MKDGGPKEPREGDTLAGRYVLVARLGEGGMGVVWEARQLTTEKPVAIKILKRSEFADAARFLREARLAASISHRNVIQVFDFWQAEGDPVFMVMELLRGETLADLLDRVGKLAPADAVAILQPVVSAVRAAHARGIVHRDLKPENVFFARGEDSEAPEIKVLDFGLAKPFSGAALADKTAMTTTGAVMGTPYYMAPEQVYGEKDIDGAADIWALGVIMYECLVGARPFEGENFGQIFRKLTVGEYRPIAEAAPTVSSALAVLVTKMLSEDRAARPTIEAVQEALATPNGERAPLDVRMVTQRLVAPSPRARTMAAASVTVGELAPPRRSSFGAVIGGAVFAGLVIGVAAFVSVRERARAREAAATQAPVTFAESTPSISSAPPAASGSANSVIASATPSSADSVAPPAPSSGVTIGAKNKPKTHPSGSAGAGAAQPTKPTSQGNEDPLGAGRF